MPEARKPLLTDEEVAFVKGNGFQRHPDAPAPEPVVNAPEPVTVEPEPKMVRNTAGLEALRQADREATVRFTVDLRVSQHKKLKRAALETELPMTALIRHIIQDWLDANTEG